MGTTALIRIVAILAIVLIVASGLWYVTGLRADIAVSEENAKKLQAAVDLQHNVIEQIKADQEQIQQLNTELASTVRAQRQDMQALSDRFSTSANGSKRDIGELAVAKPSAVERAINRGTANALRCVEIATGSTLTESEKNATKSNEINKECPALANPRYKPAIVN